MKATILVVGLGTLGLFQAMAQPAIPTQSASATVTEQTSFAKQMPKLVTPLNLPQTKESTAVNRVGGISSQPWSEISEREQHRQGFPKNETPEPKFDLLSVNFGSHR